MSPAPAIAALALALCISAVAAATCNRELELERDTLSLHVSSPTALGPVTRDPGYPKEPTPLILLPQDKGDESPAALDGSPFGLVRTCVHACRAARTLSLQLAMSRMTEIANCQLQMIHLQYYPSTNMVARESCAPKDDI